MAVNYVVDTTPDKPEKKGKTLSDNPTLDEIAALADEDGDGGFDIDLGVGEQDGVTRHVEEEDNGDGVEIIDDTPDADKGRGKAPADSSYEEEDAEIEKQVQELEKLGKKGAAERIRSLTRERHDERRAKEETMRGLAAATEYARSLYVAAEKLIARNKALETGHIDLNKAATKSTLEQVQQKFQDAMEAGDAKAIADATIALNRAVSAETAAQNAKPSPDMQPPAPPEIRTVDSRLADFKEKNKDWWQVNPVLTESAMGFHRLALTPSDKGGKGLTPNSKEYYDFIETNMKPQLIASGLAPVEKTREKVDPPRKRQQGVTPVANSSGAAKQTNSTPGKITLTASQASLARELMPHIPVNQAYREYAKQLQHQQRNEQ